MTNDKCLMSNDFDQQHKEKWVKEYATNPELRYNITSREWVVIAPRRDARFTRADIEAKNVTRIPAPIEECPFEDPQASGNKDPHFTYSSPDSGEWTLQVLENKYPAVTHEGTTCALERNRDGLSWTMQGRGYHDLIITRSHTDNFCDLTLERADDVLRAMQQRYRQVMKDPCVHYVSVFQNWGTEAGASLYHPHYQMLTLPVTPIHVSRSLDASLSHYHEHKACIHCGIIEQELSEGARVVYQNAGAVGFVPFAAKESFQVNVFPLQHSAYFEDAEDSVREAVADVMQHSLRAIREHAKDPDYNFFLHTAPASEKESHHHYHWHFEIVPKSNISAGFELGTGMEINPVVPEQAAALLRGEK